MSNLIDSVRTYLIGCPLLNDGRVNVDYIGEEMCYSVDPLPCDPIIKRYVDGGTRKQFQFAFTSNEEYDQDARINIENSGFYQELDEWMERNNFIGELPKLGKGKFPVAIETLNSGYLYDVDGNKAKYRIECRLIYEQEV